MADQTSAAQRIKAARTPAADSKDFDLDQKPSLPTYEPSTEEAEAAAARIKASRQAPAEGQEFEIAQMPHSPAVKLTTPEPVVSPPSPPREVDSTPSAELIKASFKGGFEGTKDFEIDEMPCSEAAKAPSGEKLMSAAERIKAARS